MEPISKRQRIILKTLISGGFLLLLAIVGGVSFYAYRQVGTLTQLLWDNTRPNDKILAIKNLETDLNFAESKLRAFVFTQDPDALKACLDAANQADSTFSTLKRTYPSDPLVDRIDIMVDEKVLLFERMLEVSREMEAFNPLESFQEMALADPPSTEAATVSDTVVEPPADSLAGLSKKEIRQLRREEKKQQKAENATATVEEDTTNGKPGFFDRMFKWKQIAQSIEEAQIEETQEAVSQETSRQLDRLRVSADRIQELEASQRRRQISRLEVYLAKDEEINQEIHGILHDLELTERREMESAVITAEEATNETSFFLAVFLLSVFLLVLLLTIIIFRAFSKNMKLQRQLVEEKERAETLAHAKEEFLANMSHEFRTPLNAIIGFSDALAKTPLNERQAHHLKAVGQASRHLLALINDVLDYSKITSGNFTLESIPFSPGEVFEESLEIFRSKAEEKGLSLECKGAERLPAQLTGDPTRLKQILLNLIGNSIKFTEHGGITVSVLPGKKIDQNWLLHVEVLDTGIGIPEDKLTTIFESFQQENPAIARKYGGTGLGLSITQHLVKLQGGDLQVNSAPGQGTSMVIRIPYKRSAPTEGMVPERGVSEGLSPGFLRGRKVLIAEDDPYNRELIDMLLQSWGVEASLVDNGAEALQRLQSRAYDWIMVDWHLPDTEGDQLIPEIRQHKHGKVPLILWTASTKMLQEDHRDGKAKGADGILLKPFKEEVLLKMLQQLLPPKEEVPASGREYDLSNLKSMASGNPAFWSKMVGIFIKSAEETISGLTASRASGNMQEMVHAAHKLLGPCRHMEIAVLVERLTLLESHSPEKTMTDDLKAELKDTISLIRAVVEEMKKELREFEQEAVD